MRLTTFLLRPFQFVYCIYAYALFIAIMILIFPFVILSSFFGRIRGGNWILRLCALWGHLWFPLIGIFFRKKFMSRHDRARPYIFVTNHSSYLDAAILPRACPHPFRPLGKIELSRIPIFGYIYQNAIVTVDRSSAANRAQSVRILKSLLGKGISVMVFPEGTFNMTERPLKSFYDGAFRIAIETETSIKPVLYLDAGKRLHHRSVFSLTPGRCRILYLPEIPVTGRTLEDVAALRQEVYQAMEQALRRFK